MSFISEFETSSTLSPLQAASRFDAYFDVYGLSLKQAADESQRAVTLIARSPASPIAQALAINLSRFEPQSMEVAIIFAHIAPPEALDFMIQALRASCAQAPEAIIRWAKNRALLDAHERLTLGETLCWTGDAMRRTEDTRSAIDRVDDANPQILAEAHGSFAALWKASSPLPKMLLSRPFAQRPERAISIQPPFASDLFGERNVVRLEDYLRSRKH